MGVKKAIYQICTEHSFLKILCKLLILCTKNVDNVDNFVDNSLLSHFRGFKMWITFGDNF